MHRQGTRLVQECQFNAVAALYRVAEFGVDIPQLCPHNVQPRLEVVLEPRILLLARHGATNLCR